MIIWQRSDDQFLKILAISSHHYGKVGTAKDASLVETLGCSRWWCYSTPLEGGGTEEFYIDPTVGPCPKVWTSGTFLH